MQLCVRFMRESIVVDTVCEFVQVNVPAIAFSLALSLMASPFQAALTYQQITLQEECPYIHRN